MFINENNLKELPQADVIPPSLELDSAASVRGDVFIMEQEVWHDIPGWMGEYQLSSILRVRSLDRVMNGLRGQRRCKGKILPQQITWNGYHTVRFQRPGKSIGMYLHRLVALTHIPNPENKKEVNHIDGNKNNNHQSNLEWVTRHENIAHAFKMGLIKTCVGVKQSQTVLTEEQVMYIMAHPEIGAREMARQLKLKYHTAVSAIRLGKSWNHITGLPRKCDNRKFKL